MTAPEEPSVSAASQVSAPAKEAPTAGSGFIGWFLGRKELTRARADAARFSKAQLEYLRRSKVAFELGELALSPGNAVPSGSSAPLAVNLFRQSVYWALRAESALPEVDPARVWAAADPALLAEAIPSESERAHIAATMPSTFIELADGSVDVQRATAESLRRASRKLQKHVHIPLWRLEWAKLKRNARLSVVFALCLVPLFFAVAHLLRKPDLAVGKPWHLSSVGLVCHPDKTECGGVATDIFFHTGYEDNPWFEYDFGGPLSFSSLTIKNRSDDGVDRALPLIVEVSNDDKEFHEVIRRTDAFATWRPSFATQHARYLRLRVPRKTILHLEAVKVHP